MNWIILKRCGTTIALEIAEMQNAPREDQMSLASLIITEENLRAPKNMQKAKLLILKLITVIDSCSFRIIIISSVY